MFLFRFKLRFDFYNLAHRQRSAAAVRPFVRLCMCVCVHSKGCGFVFVAPTPDCRNHQVNTAHLTLLNLGKLNIRRTDVNVCMSAMHSERPPPLIFMRRGGDKQHTAISIAGIRTKKKNVEFIGSEFF